MYDGHTRFFVPLKPKVLLRLDRTVAKHEPYGFSQGYNIVKSWISKNYEII